MNEEQEEHILGSKEILNKSNNEDIDINNNDNDSDYLIQRNSNNAINPNILNNTNRNNNINNNLDRPQQYIDKLINSLSFKLNHLALLMIGMCCNISKGYILIHFFYCVSLYYEVFYWNTKEVSYLVLLFYSLSSLGNFFSQNYVSKDWNVVSHGILAFVVLLNLLMITLVRQSIVYAICLLIFGFCLGFLEISIFVNIIDTFSFKYRRVAYLSIHAGYLIGAAYCSIVIVILDGLDILNPCWYLFGLLLLWIIPPFFSFWLEESPRVLYYYNNSFLLAETVTALRQYKPKNTHFYIAELKRVEEEIEKSKRLLIPYRPKYHNFFSGYYYSFTSYQKNHSGLSITIIMVQTTLYLIIRGIEPSLVAMGVDNYTNLLYDDAGWKLLVGFISEIVVFFFLVFLFYLLGNSKGIWFTLVLYIICLIIIILFIIFKQGYIYFLSAIEVIMFFNMVCVYLKCLETCLSVSRNALSALLNISFNLISIIIFLIRNNVLEDMFIVGVVTFCIMLFISFYLEYLIYDPEYKNKDIGQYEKEIMRAIPKPEDEYYR